MAKSASETTIHAKRIAPFSSFEWMIALRYLRPKRKEGYISVISLLSLLGIMIGVAALIIVMSVMNGFRDELLSKILGLNGHAIVQSQAGNLEDFNAVAARVRKVPGVTRVYPIVDGQVVAASSSTNSGVIVRGMTPGDLAKDVPIASTLSPHALARFKAGDSVILGSGLAEALGLVPGMRVTLMAPRGTVTPFGVTPRIKSYIVAGTFNIGMSEYDKSFIFMPLTQAQLFFNTNSGVSGLEVMIKNPDRADMMAGVIEQAAGPGTRVLTWQDMNSSLVGAINV
ncbi:MAG: ABC transporter permease, partial [Alphaproteobacteria bacterium]|nr:ABC transporter permease [Alphaproteobacteria bacterium]